MCGIAMDSDHIVWMAGWATLDLFRHRPDRTSSDVAPGPLDPTRRALS